MDALILAMRECYNSIRPVARKLPLANDGNWPKPGAPDFEVTDRNRCSRAFQPRKPSTLVERLLPSSMGRKNAQTGPASGMTGLENSTEIHDSPRTSACAAKQSLTIN
jgi:hypothetical protein